MKRTNHLDIQRGSLFEQGLYLSPVFADDIDIIAPSFVRPVLVRIQRAEFAKSVGRKQNFFMLLIGDHYLRPMHHGRHKELQCVCTKRKRVALFGYDRTAGPIQRKNWPSMVIAFALATIFISGYFSART